MLLEILYPLVMLGLAGSGIAIFLSPDTFITRANPTLQLLKTHLSETVARRTAQCLGLVVVCVSLIFLYVLL